MSEYIYIYIYIFLYVECSKVTLDPYIETKARCKYEGINCMDLSRLLLAISRRCCTQAAAMWSRK